MVTEATAASRPGAPAPAAIIYDDRCGMCRGFVEWLRRRDAAGRFEFVPCASELRASRFPQVRSEDCERAMQLVRVDGAVLAGADAFPEVLSRIPGWTFPARVLGWRAMRPLSRAIYRRVAASRRRDGGPESCELRS